MEHIFEESVSQIMVMEIVYKYKKDPELVLLMSRDISRGKIKGIGIFRYQGREKRKLL